MKIIASNSKANYDYFISEKIQAGLVLTGAEVKSLRFNSGSIRGSFIIEKNGSLWLTNCFIKKYENSNNLNYDPNRERKLLISKKQFEKILGLLKQGGFSIIPLSLYFADNGLAKLLLGLGKGKKKYDKRQSIREKDWNIKKQRMLKNN
tara:strand:+ start:2069 stop:2515 length:447 start_codon:yes stop_codon:yes gene_type:complete